MRADLKAQWGPFLSVCEEGRDKLKQYHEAGLLDLGCISVGSGVGRWLKVQDSIQLLIISEDQINKLPNLCGALPSFLLEALFLSF